jgi:ParB family transcriptional regulator, chromosome partitioning protein
VNMKPNAQPLEEIYEIRVKDIRISEDNVRLSDPLKDLDELAASIKRHGLLQPVVLAGKPGHPPYSLVSGQRRFLAHEKILKWPTIRALFAGQLSKTEAVVRSLVENMQRLDLEYEDTAQAVTYLYEKLGKDEYAVQQETGLSIRRIREFVLIEARATPTMKAMLRKKELSPADVKRAIRAAQDNLKKAEELLELIVKYKPTSHQKRRLVTYGERKAGASAKRILEEAMKPHVEQNMVITLPDEVREALAKATKSLSIEPEELAAKVLSDWLRDQGFI